MVKKSLNNWTMILAFYGFMSCFANGVEVYLPPTKISDLTMPVTNLWTVLPSPPPEHEIRLPLGMPFGQSIHTNEVNSSEVIVVATIARVVLVAITELDKINGQNCYYRIICDVKKVSKGNFPHPQIEFLCQYGFERPLESWPYVKGFCYRFGLNRKPDGYWQIAGQIRVSPFAPYQHSDLNRFAEWLNRLDLRKSNKFRKIKSKAYHSERVLLDSVVVNNKLLIFTYSGKSHYGELDRGRNYDDVVFEIYNVETCRLLDDKDSVYLYLHGFLTAEE